MKKKLMILGCKAFGIVFTVLFVLAWIVQGWQYGFAQWGCGSWSLEGYDYPGGGKSNLGNASFNLLPRISQMAPGDDSWGATQMSVQPCPESGCTTVEGTVGSWWKFWGPLFSIYTYEDSVKSKVTVFMRGKMLQMGLSHKMMRCDGQGPIVIIEEGSDFWGNWWHRLWGYTQGSILKIYSDDVLVALAMETNTGAKSMSIYQSGEGNADKRWSSAAENKLQSHNEVNGWVVKNEVIAGLPYWAQTGAAAIFAYAIADEGEAAEKKTTKPAPPKTKPHYLALASDETRIVDGKTFTKTGMVTANMQADARR